MSSGRTWKDVTLEEALKELDRELALRRNVYPRWVNSGKMTIEKARENQIRLIKAKKIVERALGLQEVSDEIKGNPTSQVEFDMNTQPSENHERNKH